VCHRTNDAGLPLEETPQSLKTGETPPFKENEVPSDNRRIAGPAPSLTFTRFCSDPLLTTAVASAKVGRCLSEDRFALRATKGLVAQLQRYGSLTGMALAMLPLISSESDSIIDGVFRSYHRLWLAY
jgi:hypothetical protein